MPVQWRTNSKKLVQLQISQRRLAHAKKTLRWNNNVTFKGGHTMVTVYVALAQKEQRAVTMLIWTLPKKLKGGTTLAAIKDKVSHSRKDFPYHSHPLWQVQFILAGHFLNNYTVQQHMHIIMNDNCQFVFDTSSRTVTPSISTFSHLAQYMLVSPV